MPEYPTGPGHRCSRGAVIEAYADSNALSRACTPPKGCGALEGDWCRFPDGGQKHVPCISRTKQTEVTA